MANSFDGMQISMRALQAFQRELDVTGNNVANVNTPGYTRQTVDLKESHPIDAYSGKPLSIGTGVDVSSVNRIRDLFLEARRQELGSASSKVSTQQDGLSRIDSALQEPGDNGVSAALTKFYNAFSALASGADQPGNLSNVQSAGQTLTDRIRGLYSNLEDERKGRLDAVTQDIKDLQTKLNTISDLNRQIRDETTRGVDANALKDQRDQAVRDVASLVNVRVTQNADGTVTLAMGPLTLVDPAGARAVPTTFDAATGSITDGTTSYPVTGGKIAGELDVAQKIAGYQSTLDTLANTLKTSVNALYQTATNSAGVTGKSFFADTTPQTGAVDFSLDPYVAASATNIAAGVTGKPSDGGVALKISHLTSTPQAALGGKTPQDYYANLVNQIGQDTAFAKSTSATQSALLRQVDTQIQSVSGVSIDDEMANMLRFQRSYQAAAKALSVFDQTTQDFLSALK